MTNPDPFHDRHLYEDEDAIASTIKHLSFSDPENANRDYAVAFLKFMQRVAFSAEKTEGLDYEKLFELFKKSEQKD
jgi:ribosomal protein L22